MIRYGSGEKMRLSEPAEEVATFYAKMLDHEYTSNPVFNKNFFHDWRKVNELLSSSCFFIHSLLRLNNQ